MSQILPDLQPEFEAESLRWLRRRFLWYTASSGMVALAFLLIFSIGQMLSDRPSRFILPGSFVTGVLQAVIFLAPYFYLKHTRALLTRRQILRAVSIIIVIVTILEVVPGRDAADVLTQLLRPLHFQGELSTGAPMAIRAFIFYTTAAAFIPLTPREAIIPILPIVFIKNFWQGISVASGNESLATIPQSLAYSLLLPLPGLLICWVRHSRFRIHFTNRALQDRFAEISEELSVARRIHERLFPRRITTGPILLDYAYEPMRQIGGDFVFARVGPAPSGDAPPWFSLVLIDVTGHGIAAALAVNRLHGELERLFGAHPDPPPGLVLTELNRYINFAMASESVYATALAVRFDPAAGSLRWASAAHPPALLADHSGATAELRATTFLLGLSPASEFNPAEEARPFPPGASLLAYTDGAYELRVKDGDKPGEMLGLPGLTDLAARHRAAPSWSDAVLADLKSRRDGPSTDDILIVQVSHHGTP